MKLLSFLLSTLSIGGGGGVAVVANLLQPEASATRYTIYFKTRNHDVLDRAIDEASRHVSPYLSKAEMRDLTGLPPHDLDALKVAIQAIGGEVVSVSTLADSVRLEFADDANVSRDDVIRALKASSLPASNDSADGNLYDHVALVHKHGSGAVSSLPSRGEQAKTAPNDSPRHLQLAATQCSAGGSVVWKSAQTANSGLTLYGPQQVLRNVGLMSSLPFQVCCPNGEIETKTNECSSSAVLSLTARYTSTNVSNDVKIDDLETIRHTCGNLTYVSSSLCDKLGGEDAFVYSIPPYFSKPNVLYSNITLQVTTDTATGNVVLDSIGPLGGPEYSPVNWITNPLNATGPVLKEVLFGVPSKYQGSVDQIQFTSLEVGATYCYNTSAQIDYLEAQGIAATDLNISDWDAPYTPNNCTAAGYPGGGNSESMLDISALQSMAPLSTTVAAPPNTKDNGDSWDVVAAYELYFETILDLDPGVVSWSWNTQAFIQDLYYQFSLNLPKETGAQYSQESETEILAAAIAFAESNLQKLATLGYTIFVSSGDQGASGTGGGDGGGCIGPNTTKFTDNFPCNCNNGFVLQDEGIWSGIDNPFFAYMMSGMNLGYLRGNQIGNWPEFSPWVTVVGGTQLLVLEEGEDAQEVASSSATGGGVTSGGGFAGSGTPLAAVYPRPKWQDKQVKQYLENNGPDTFPYFPDKFAFGYNPNGRAVPDLASYSNSWPIIIGGGPPSNPNLPSIQSGTSLAAPLTAGLFTLINQALIEKGYKPVGYVNPMIYWMGENCPNAFNDITYGSNQYPSQGSLIGEALPTMKEGLGIGPEPCKYGFEAAPGWDPVTGLGSIKFNNFVSCAMKYQDGASGENGSDEDAQPDDSAGALSSSQTQDITSNDNDAQPVSKDTSTGQVIIALSWTVAVIFATSFTFII